MQLYYGGVDPKGVTNIFSYKNGVAKTFEYYDKNLDVSLCAFSNYTFRGMSLIEYLANKIVSQYRQMLLQSGLLLNSSLPMKNLNEFLCANYENVFNCILPYYRNSVHYDLGRETSIGKKFDFIKFNTYSNQVPLAHFGYEIEKTHFGYEILKRITGNDLISSFNYSMSKTTNDEEIARTNGYIIYYDHNHVEFKIPNAAPNNPLIKQAFDIFYHV